MRVRFIKNKKDWRPNRNGVFKKGLIIGISSDVAKKLIKEGVCVPTTVAEERKEFEKLVGRLESKGIKTE